MGWASSPFTSLAGKDTCLHFGDNLFFGVADFMYENDFFYAETPVPDVKFHVWNIQIHTSIQQRLFFGVPLHQVPMITYNKMHI